MYNNNISLFQKTGVILLFLILSFGAIAQNSITTNNQEAQYPKEAIKEAKESGEILLFDQKRIELGPIKKGEYEYLTFRFLNISDEVIEYSFFDVCSCSELTVDKDEKINPGEQGVFKIKFDSKEREDEEPVEVSIELKNIDSRVNLRYFYTVDYTFTFK